MLLSTFFGGYDLYIIAIISPLTDRKILDFMDSCSLFLLLLTFFGGYDLYIIALISPLEPERAAEARRAVVASICKRYKMFGHLPDSILDLHLADCLKIMV